MNPHNPTTIERRQIEQVFLDQMQLLSRKASNPANSFDYQCSDRWVLG